MAVNVQIPKGGMGIDEATIVKWYKVEGDRVTAGEVLVEIETAKAVEEIEAPASGILTRILLAEGETADVYAEIAVIDEDAG